VNDFGINMGAGVVGFFSDHVGVRGDVRYFAACKMLSAAPYSIFRWGTSTTGEPRSERPLDSSEPYKFQIPMTKSHIHTIFDLGFGISRGNG